MKTILNSELTLHIIKEKNLPDVKLSLGFVYISEKKNRFYGIVKTIQTIKLTFKRSPPTYVRLTIKLDIKSPIVSLVSMFIILNIEKFRETFEFKSTCVHIILYSFNILEPGLRVWWSIH